MVTVEKIIAELKIGGYLDAAEYIERQFATINRTAEFGLRSEMHKLGNANGWSEYGEFVEFMCGLLV